jgi:hypothetical protein
MMSAAIASGGIFALSHARADHGNDARAILRATSGDGSGQKSIAANFNSDIEVITPDLQKIRFDSLGQLQLSCPDKQHARRTNGYTDVELCFDGKTFAVVNRKDNLFTQVDAPRSVDQLVEKMERLAKAESTPMAILQELGCNAVAHISVSMGGELY